MLDQFWVETKLGKPQLNPRVETKLVEPQLNPNSIFLIKAYSVWGLISSRLDLPQAFVIIVNKWR